MLQNEKIQRTKFVFRHKRDVKSIVQRYEADMLKCGNEENSLQEDGSSQVTELAATKMMLTLVLNNK